MLEAFEKCKLQELQEIPADKTLAEQVQNWQDQELEKHFQVYQYASCFCCYLLSDLALSSPLVESAGLPSVKIELDKHCDEPQKTGN
jgi:hypothetical protein